MTTKIRMWEILPAERNRGFRLQGVISAPPKGKRPGDCCMAVDKTIRTSFITNVFGPGRTISSIKEGDIVMTADGGTYRIDGASRQAFIAAAGLQNLSR